MAEQQQAAETTDAAEIALRLHEIADLLRAPHDFGPEEQRALAELADELGSALEHPAKAPQATHALAEGITHLAETLRQGRIHGSLLDVRRRLQEMAAKLEARSPDVAVLSRQIVDALSGLGI